MRCNGMSAADIYSCVPGLATLPEGLTWDNQLQTMTSPTMSIAEQLQAASGHTLWWASGPQTPDDDSLVACPHQLQLSPDLLLLREPQYYQRLLYITKRHQPWNEARHILLLNAAIALCCDLQPRALA